MLFPVHDAFHLARDRCPETALHHGTQSIQPLEGQAIVRPFRCIVVPVPGGDVFSELLLECLLAVPCILVGRPVWPDINEPHWQRCAIAAPKNSIVNINIIGFSLMFEDALEEFLMGGGNEILRETAIVDRIQPRSKLSQRRHQACLHRGPAKRVLVPPRYQEPRRTLRDLHSRRADTSRADASDLRQRFEGSLRTRWATIREGVPIGLASYKSLKHHHNSKTMVRSHSFMDHTKSHLHHSAWRMGRMLADHLKIFTVETTLNNAVFPAPYEFLLKREWEWSIKDQASMLAIRRGLAVAPDRLKHKMFHDLRAPYGLTGVHAGETEAVHERTIANVHRQQLVEVQGQSDVLVMGVPYLGPYNVNSTMNPILATCMGLGYYFNSYRGQPLVRKGGAVILYHPVKPDFNQLHHPSYVDFYEEVLAESTDPAVIEAKYEQQYATDPWYIHLYRTSHAYHGVHPFYMWYWAAHAMDHVGEVIWVGANRKAVARLGFRAASSLADALEMASGTVGGSPSITFLRNPPHLIADVR